MTTGETRYVGARIPRREDPRFLTGETSYVADVRLPHTLHAAFVRSPHAHADVTRVEVQQALKYPGVVAVLTGEEAARAIRPLHCDAQFPGWQSAEYPPLGWPRVRYVGEAVAVVVATDPYVAEDGAELVDVRYRPLPAVTDPEAASTPGAPLLHEGWRSNLFLELEKQGGNPDEAFAQADLVLERTYRMQRHTGFPLEPRGGVAHYQPGSRLLTYYAATQVPHLLRTKLADCLGFPEHSLRVVSGDVGGGFGIKIAAFPEDVCACWLSIRLGRPVKWIEDTREHLLVAGHAREHVHRVRVAVKRDGTILGMDVDVLTDAGAYSTWPATAALDPVMAANVIPGPYKIRHYRARIRAVATNKCPMVAYRGVGRPAAAFTMERVVEDVARALGRESLEIRRLNYLQAQDYPYTSVTGMVYDSGSLGPAQEKVVEAIGYANIRAEQRRLRGEGRYLGIGFGSFVEQTAHTPRSMSGSPISLGYDQVAVAMDPSGQVTVESSLHSHGQGHETILAQVVADRLGVRLEDVRVTFGDTRSAPYGMGTFASRSAVLGGGAAWKAADRVRRAVLTVAAHRLEANQDDLELRDGTIQVKGSPQHRLTVGEVARLAFHRADLLPAGVRPGDFASACDYDAHPGTGTWTNAIHAAVVEVDVRTGAVRIIRYVVVEDCGVMINPLIVDGQVHGGTVQGIGGTMLEHLVYDPQGQLLSQTLMEYLLPTALDVPTIEVHHLQTPSPFTIGGIKGMGEGGAIGPYPALANAVSDALAPLGVSIDTLPISPERLRALLDAATGGA
jgi:carbon-monoxide dehydrogenase large subunit